MASPGRNDPCPCGSGRKYKQCCLAAGRPPASQSVPQPARPPGGVRLDANSPEVWQALQSALAAFRGGRATEAEALARRIVQAVPDHADALHLLGLIAAGRRDHHAALGLLKRAVSLRDSEAEFHVNLGRVHHALQQTAEAIACYRRALALKPELPQANSNLGGILANLQQVDEAMTLCRRALDADPKLAAAWCNLGIAAYHQRDYDLAVDSCEKALALWPDSVQALHILGASRVMQGRVDEGIELLERTLALQPDYARAHGSLLFALLYRAGTSADELFAAHRRFGELIEAPLRASWPTHIAASTSTSTSTSTEDTGRRLRIGYVSPDFRHHSVAFFVEPLLAHHDHAAFEIFAYYNHPAEDDTTRRIRGLVDHWVPCARLSDDDLAARIRADRIDILVDLAGHSGKNRLPVFARRPAPVQVTWLGYPTTTGLTAIDWRLTTADVDPEGSDQWYTERLYRLPRTLWCYRPATADDDNDDADADADADAATASRLRPALSSDSALWFGSMNSFAKVSQQAIALWARILNAVPDAQLAMTHVPEGSTTRALRERFAAHGIATDRLHLHNRLPAADFRALAARIDIALDPFPYTGTTTTCESLWLGIPVVTLTGDQSVSRSGHALLHMIGLGELCASDEDDYVRIATALATNSDRRAELRSSLRERFERSPLRDEQGFAREVEEAFRCMLQERKS